MIEICFFVLARQYIELGITFTIKLSLNFSLSFFQAMGFIVFFSFSHIRLQFYFPIFHICRKKEHKHTHTVFYRYILFSFSSRLCVGVFKQIFAHRREEKRKIINRVYSFEPNMYGTYHWQTFRKWVWLLDFYSKNFIMKIHCFFTAKPTEQFSRGFCVC